MTIGSSLPSFEHIALPAKRKRAQVCYTEPKYEDDDAHFLDESYREDLIEFEPLEAKVERIPCITRRDLTLL